jgi:hypothetical protein
VCVSWWVRKSVYVCVCVFVCMCVCVQIRCRCAYFRLPVWYFASLCIHLLSTNVIASSLISITLHTPIRMSACVYVCQINAIAAHLITNMEQIKELLGDGADLQTVCALVSTSTSLVLKRLVYDSLVCSFSFLLFSSPLFSSPLLSPPLFSPLTSFLFSLCTHLLIHSLNNRYMYTYVHLYCVSLSPHFYFYLSLFCRFI